MNSYLVLSGTTAISPVPSTPQPSASKNSRVFASIVTFDYNVDNWTGDALIEVVIGTQELLDNFEVSSEQLILPSYFDTAIQKQEYRNILAQAEWIKQCLAWSAWYAGDRDALFILVIRTDVRGDMSNPASLWLTSGECPDEHGLFESTRTEVALEVFFESFKNCKCDVVLMINDDIINVADVLHAPEGTEVYGGTNGTPIEDFRIDLPFHPRPVGNIFND